MSAMATKKRRTPKAEKPRIGRPPSGKEQRMKIVQTRVRSDENAALEAWAKREGKTVATLMRIASLRAAGFKGEVD